MLPRCASHLPAVTAQARRRPEDTSVSEVLTTTPDGGDHFWLQVQLRGLSCRQAVAAVARAAKVDPQLIAHGGARDRHAVVTQWMTVPKAPVENPGQLSGAGYKRQLKVLQVREGAGPMSPAAVSAMQWTLMLRDGVANDGFARAQEMLRYLRQTGVPNYFAANFQGPGGSHARWGRLLAAGKRLPAAAATSRSQRIMYYRAWQARLFNAWVATRLSEHGLATVLPGDQVQTGLGQAPAQRDLVVVDDAAAFNKRVEAWESVVMGPLFGRDCEPLSGPAGAVEAQVVAEHGPPPGADIYGGRRPLRFQPKGAEVEMKGKDLRVTCQAPVEAFVAILAEELTQPQGHLA